MMSTVFFAADRLGLCWSGKLRIERPMVGGLGLSSIHHVLGALHRNQLAWPLEFFVYCLCSYPQIIKKETELQSSQVALLMRGRTMIPAQTWKSLNLVFVPCLASHTLGRR